MAEVVNLRLQARGWEHTIQDILGESQGPGRILERPKWSSLGTRGRFRTIRQGTKAAARLLRRVEYYLLDCSW